jgi:SAM-dependent methyltransferase
MMFGTRKEFIYWECLGCGCLQISVVPNNLGDYYPKNYYSFSIPEPAWKNWYYRAHFEFPALMRLLRRCPPDISSVIAANPKPGARILDVGCGGGQLVRTLRRFGYEAYGTDPFLKAKLPYLRNSLLEDIDDEWDLIMFHHSLEHMQNHAETLRCARSKLAPGGVCLVRIPVATWAWEHYGRDWVQLDAPRHFVIHTPKSFLLTAESAGFQTIRVIFDSNEFQFFASELYQRDIPLQDCNVSEQLSRSKKRGYRAHADRLNRDQLGDQAAFFLSNN